MLYHYIILNGPCYCRHKTCMFYIHQQREQYSGIVTVFWKLSFKATTLSPQMLLYCTLINVTFLMFQMSTHTAFANTPFTYTRVVYGKITKSYFKAVVLSQFDMCSRALFTLLQVQICSVLIIHVYSAYCQPTIQLVNTVLQNEYSHIQTSDHVSLFPYDPNSMPLYLYDIGVQFKRWFKHIYFITSIHSTYTQ